MRRKSSSFRPHNWIYPFHSAKYFPKELILEQLPLVILELIFDHLQKHDLLQLCLVSRYFYLPAANRLYQTIRITGDPFAADHAQDLLGRYILGLLTLVMLTIEDVPLYRAPENTLEKYAIVTKLDLQY